MGEKLNNSNVLLIIVALLTGGNMVYEPRGPQLDAIATETRATSDAVQRITGRLDRIDSDVFSIRSDLEKMKQSLGDLKWRAETNTVNVRTMRQVTETALQMKIKLADPDNPVTD